MALVLAAAAAAMESGAVGARKPLEPRLDASSRLPRPEAYREWIWLSSGLGMSYGPDAGATDDHPAFDNVFVTPAAYRSFLQTGRWSDGTMFVLEVRASESRGSINRAGFYQGVLRGVEVEVKAKGAWTFYGFGDKDASAAPLPRTASCYRCHAANGAVDNTFVQFYPTLADVARARGTFEGSRGHERQAVPK